MTLRITLLSFLFLALSSTAIAQEENPQGVPFRALVEEDARLQTEINSVVEESKDMQEQVTAIQDELAQAQELVAELESRIEALENTTPPPPPPSEPNTGSLEFDGASYLTISDNDQEGLRLTNNFTIEMMVRLLAEPTAEVTWSLAGKWTEAPPSPVNQRSYWLFYRQKDGMKQLGLRTSPDGVAESIGAVDQSLTAGVWYHVAVTFDSAVGLAEFFVNGASIGIVPGYETPLHNGSAPFEVGAANNLRFLNARIDELRIWNVKRSVGEIATARNAQLVGNESGLVGYWRFNADLLDKTANENNLSPVGTPEFSSDVPFQ